MGIDLDNMRRGEPWRGAGGVVSRSVHLVIHLQSSFMVSHCFLEVVTSQGKCIESKR